MHRTPRFRHALIAVAVATGVAAGSAVAFTQTEQAARWDVAEMAAGGRAIDLFYVAGGCQGEARATAAETATSVTLTVRQSVVVPGAGEACTAEILMRSTRVQLAAPLGGRAIKGRPFPAASAFGPGAGQVAVPRLVGFSPWEAKRALRLRGLAAQVRRSTGGSGIARIAAQAPAAGTKIVKGAIVHLRVARR